jgi:hypothetical protein
LNEDALAKETAQFKQVGARKDQIEEREDFYKALVESRYRGERADLLAIIEQWFADALRQQHGSPDLEYASYRERTANWPPMFNRRTAAPSCSTDRIARPPQQDGE